MARKDSRMRLVVYHRKPGYIDGEVRIGLFEAEDDEDARQQARAACKPMEVVDHELLVAEIGEMVTLLREKTDYDG